MIVGFTQKGLLAAQQNLALAMDEHGSSSQRISEARQILDDAEDRFKKAEKILTKSDLILVKSKEAMSKCEAEGRAAAS